MKSYLFTKLGLLLAFSNYIAAKTLYQCTPDEADSDGLFKCLPGCDENHQVDGPYGMKPYCLSYFPDNGNCYMKPYTRNEIFTCGGEGGGSNPPVWMVFIGGSNMFMMVKTLLDELLDLPGDTWYDPKAQYNAQVNTADGKAPYGELAVLDLVWNSNKQVIHKTAWWWDGLVDNNPQKTKDIFLAAGNGPTGGYRLSYINMKYAEKFVDRFERIAPVGSPFLNSRPTIHIWEEWSGMWGDSDIPQSVHENNIYYLKGRVNNEGLNIASYVFTDSGPNCNSAEKADVNNKIKGAISSVATPFPKYFFSKQNMMYNHYQLTTKCTAHGGHTNEPMNIVMWQRYFNLACNSHTDRTYQERIPACLDLGDWENANNRCFGSEPNGNWMDNIMQVCLVDYRTIANENPCTVRVADAHALERIAANKQQHKKRICKLQHVRVVDPDANEDAETDAYSEHYPGRRAHSTPFSLMRQFTVEA